MDDVFDVLAQDHEDVRQMLAELEKGPTEATGASDDQLMLRTIMTEELVNEESRHESAERIYLWPALRAYVPDGGPLADQAICQQLELGELLAELRQLEAAQPRFETVLCEFIRICRTHIEFKERLVWPRLRAALPPKAAAELGRLIEHGKQVSSLLPHPRASAAPGS
jgi:hypothetical protein